ncbi:hypothetical protein [Amantichitinum ursilacus]|uniref:Uncharacterized protein n=1 Tax=Amantichitinum ursilacus TaxID=857265 RepID=A0A0N0GNW9_9NEIS|nr:hypothetical protein [Amantichitinum ursilacus]KPC53156.1 hypothetical protein WG78_08700 [Amantichitinum ursilacus]
MKKLRFSNEYGVPPFFCPDAEAMGFMEASEPGISSQLSAEIESWDTIFQSTFHDDYPPDSGFKTKVN